MGVSVPLLRFCYTFLAMTLNRFLLPVSIFSTIFFQVDEAVKAAQNDPIAPIETLYTDVYHNTPKQFIRCATLDDSIVQPHATSAEALKAAGFA